MKYLFVFALLTFSSAAFCEMEPGCGEDAVQIYQVKDVAEGDVSIYRAVGFYDEVEPSSQKEGCFPKNSIPQCQGVNYLVYTVSKTLVCMTPQKYKALVAKINQNGRGVVKETPTAKKKKVIHRPAGTKQ